MGRVCWVVLGGRANRPDRGARMALCSIVVGRQSSANGRANCPDRGARTALCTSLANTPVQTGAPTSRTELLGWDCGKLTAVARHNFPRFGSAAPARGEFAAP